MNFNLKFVNAGKKKRKKKPEDKFSPYFQWSQQLPKRTRIGIIFHEAWSSYGTSL